MEIHDPPAIAQSNWEGWVVGRFRFSTLMAVIGLGNELTFPSMKSICFNVGVPQT